MPYPRRVCHPAGGQRLRYLYQVHSTVHLFSLHQHARRSYRCPLRRHPFSLTTTLNTPRSAAGSQLLTAFTCPRQKYLPEAVAGTRSGSVRRLQAARGVLPCMLQQHSLSAVNLPTFAPRQLMRSTPCSHQPPLAPPLVQHHVLGEIRNATPPELPLPAVGRHKEFWPRVGCSSTPLICTQSPCRRLL